MGTEPLVYYEAMKTVAQQWFGEHFNKLHPELQALHTQGGILFGEVEVSYGAGLASLIGKRLGKKLGLPATAGVTDLRVEITHTDDAMIWSRQFGNAPNTMTSFFSPQGTYPSGSWTETTGAITIDLGIEIRSGEWHWVQRAAKLMGLPIPARLLPALTANKFVSDGRYHFNVMLSQRGLGVLVQYGGALSIDAGKPLD